MSLLTEHFLASHNALSLLLAKQPSCWYKTKVEEDDVSLSRPEAVRIPAFDLGRVRQWRKKIIQRLASHYDTMVDEDRFDEFVGALQSLLKLDDDDQQLALRQSMLEFVGREFTLRTGERLATKLAGGLSLLRNGKAVTGTLDKPDWFPVMITDLRFWRVIKGKTRLTMTVMVMAGNMSGRVLTKSITYKLAVWMLANELAWSKKDMRPLHSEMVGMWFMGFVEPRDDGTLDISEFKCLGQHKRYNKRLRKMRSRKCVRHYNQRCHTCPVGYSECMLGTHHYTWLIKPCPMCGREKAAFDPEQGVARSCILCRTRDVRTHWARERMS